MRVGLIVCSPTESVSISGTSYAVAELDALDGVTTTTVDGMTCVVTTLSDAVLVTAEGDVPATYFDLWSRAGVRSLVMDAVAGVMYGTSRLTNS